MSIGQTSVKKVYIQNKLQKYKKNYFATFTFVERLINP